ncbi:MrcB family domain-containing protein [Pseudoalteromonas sp. SR43-3]|uniref:MrcB family domain-containing protein n=1 Tax=Pseudoalteromonas sp. SR43-3 TaxID=2760943 RepID=UPI0016044851|nr:DUF3578 domain-containing protein [Pseudoalteromonas sp. SR43-3]MBB1275818.1 DUF3578 domain-containing protein [Pseudoalteromonas sp. SR43-3]
MLNLIKELSELWPSYYALTKEDSKNKAYKLIHDTLPKSLRPLNEGKKHLLVASSGGQGNITAGPWFATFDERITTRAEEGYYLVFLFSIDMKKIVLELGFATGQFTKFYGVNKNTYKIMRDAALMMQEATTSICNDFPHQEFITKLNREPSDLSTLPPTSKHKLQKGYEQASIYSLSYDIDKLEGSSLLEDYGLFLELYQRIAVDPLVPSVESLLGRTIENSPLNTELNIPAATNFSIRAPKKVTSNTPSKSSFNGKRRSKDAKAVGDMGEKIVLAFEKNKLSNHPELLDKIVHEEAEKNRPGWDISSYNENGEKMRIEVKASSTSIINSLTITSNEWQAAKKYGDSYYIYLVYDVTARGASRIEIIKNPVEYYNNQLFSIQIESYNLKLNS